MKRAILFVDDDANVILGLKRSLRSFSQDYDLYFAGSGAEALTLLGQQPVDVLVTDMRMPGMNGAELLEQVSEKYPHIIRFILTGHTDQELALKSSRVAHQFLAKPCDTKFLVETIQHSLQLRGLQSNPNLVKIITSINKLPSLPSLYLQLVNELNSPDNSIKRIGEIIAQDITMTAKILQLVNSAFYGLPSRETNLQHAVSLLGTQTLKSLVLFEGVFSEFQANANSPIALDMLWTHSISVGNLARQIARKAACETYILDDSQVAGVMHDIGKLILLKIPDYFHLAKQKELEGLSPLEAEYTILGTSHAELGAYLLGIWGLPDNVVQAVAYHHLPSRVSSPTFNAVSAVHIANAFLNPWAASVGVENSFPYLLDLPYMAGLKMNNIAAWLQVCQDFMAKPSR